MKYQLASLLALAGAVTAVPAPAPAAAILPASAQGPACVYPIGQHPTAPPKAVGRVFEIDGQVEYFAGTNAWWLGHLNNNSDIDTSLAEIKATGYKIVRVWGFGDVTTLPPTDAPFGTYFHVLNATGSYINYGADGLQRLDYAVHAAENHGLKLVLNFVNNWGDMGGIAAYNAAFGGNATTWYTDKVSQQVYRDYIKVIVNRYKSSNAIFAWELGNEPRCHGCPSSTIYNWASSISQYIKSLDGSHMVTLGDEGWFAPTTKFAGNDGSYAYSLAEGVDFELNLKIKTLDYGVFHLYPDSWGYNYTWGSEWIAQHDTVGAKANKPVILEEYGTPFPNNHTATEAPWQAAVLSSGLAADQIWQFGSLDLSVALSSISDVNTIVYGSAEYPKLGTQHAKAMLAKKVHH